MLKDKLTIIPTVGGPNWARPFHIHAHASDKYVGIALAQIYDKFPYAIYFIRKIMSKAELNYTMIEKELLVVVHSLNKFGHYINGYKNCVHIVG